VNVIYPAVYAKNKFRAGPWPSATCKFSCHH
jgi:hypothetical protein